MRTLPVSQKLVNFNFKTSNLSTNPIETNFEQPTIDTIPEEKPDKKPLIKKEKVMPLVTAAVAVAALGVSIYATKGKSKSATEEIEQRSKRIAEDLVNDLKQGVEKTAKDLEGKIEKVETSADGLSQKIETNAKEIAAKAEWHDNHLKAIDSKMNSYETKQNETFRPKEKNLAYVQGLGLLQNVENNGKRVEIKEGLIPELKAIAQTFMTGKDPKGAALGIAALGVGSTVWLPTAESLPEKEGGLAEVPVQMAMNMDKMGINNYIVRPLMEIPGKSTFYQMDNDYYYYFAGLDQIVKDPLTGKDRKEKRPMKLEKVAEFNTNVFRNGQYETQPVEVFYGVDTVNGYKRLMFRNQNYFGAPGLYNSTQMVTEAERYTFFNKAMYEFMKMKMDPSSVQGYNIPNKSLFEQIKVPDAMVLNDWHCGPTAALMRYKAPIEASAGELNGKAADRIKNMNLLYIVHNSDYQGDDYGHTSEIMNTLFDKYSYDIYEFAQTRFKDGDDNKIESLKNVMLIDGGINMANMGMCLANKVKPVSKTYADEMATRPERARGLMHVTDFRLKNGTLEGASNGWDRVSNEIAPDSRVLKQTNNMLNKDIDFIENVVSKYPNFHYEIPSKRTAKPVVSTMSMDEIMENSKHNKKMFVEYLKSSLAYNQAATEYNSKQVTDSDKVPLINFDTTGVSDLSDVDIDRLDEIPVLTMGVRFTDQKGVDIVSKSLVSLYKNWDSIYPGKEKPIVVIGGQDKEGDYRKIAQKMKRDLGEDGKRVLYMDGFTPNPAFYAGSDFTLRPSHFEPDGDKWESLYRGTPMIMTRVGGHVDSIKDGVNGFLSKRTVTDICNLLDIKYIKENGVYNYKYLEAMASDYEEAIKRGLAAFYNKDQYRYLVDNAIHGEQSWVQMDEDGNFKDCPLVSHMKDLGFDFSDGVLAKNYMQTISAEKKENTEEEEKALQKDMNA